MTNFDEREKSFEKKFEHDHELAFKAKARRNKLLGLWAAEQLGLTGDAAEAYAKELVEVEVTHATRAGDEAVVTKVAGDLAKSSVKLDDFRVREELRRLGEEARKQLGLKS